MATTARAQLSQDVQAALAPAARYVALIVRNSPHGTAGELLARPDVSATLTDALTQAREAAAALVTQEWAGAPDSDLLGHLLDDVTRQYGTLAQLRAAIGAAYAAKPTAAERAAAVRRAVLFFARKAAVRSGLTLEFARTAADAVRVLERGRDRRRAGEPVRKRWMARKDACYWCRSLDGVTVGLDESFAPHLAGPADLSGHGRLTQPPRIYHGVLLHPPLHPHCRCRLVVVTQVPPHDEPEEPPAPAGPVLVASEIRAMPEAKYKGLVAFLNAALHELGQVISRLASRS